MGFVSRLATVFLFTLSPLFAADPSPNSWPDATAFATPPAQYGVETWWHWINGNLTKDGITRDLQAMREQGIPRATILAVSMGGEGPVNPLLSEVWLDHWRYTASEASRIGVKLATHLGPGWSETGGPWIKPENSMKRIVWSQLLATGGEKLELDLPPLPEFKGWSKDIAVLAWPVNRTPTRMLGSTVQSNGKPVENNALFDGNPATGADTETPTKWRFDFTFPTPHECDRAQFFIRWKRFGPPSNKIRLHISADGKPLHETEIDGSKFNSVLAIPFPATKASQISLEWEIVGAVENWETFRQVQMGEVELLNGSESPQWMCELRNLPQQTDDSGTPGTPNWSPSVTPPLPAANIVDLTAQVANGHLSWNAPAGSWRIVRFGFTTTGTMNTVPQKGGYGLESDKMSVVATDLHFRSYMKPLLEAIPAAQRNVLDTVLLDSWEAGRQNWTDDLPAEFQRRRAYGILPYLAVFAGEVVGSRQETERFLNDFRETVGELITERFYGRNAQLLREQNIQFAVELSDSAPPALDIFAVARLVDQPMDEFWSDNNDGTIPVPREAPPRQSLVPEAAFLAGKPIVDTEAFTSNAADFRRTPGDYGHLGDHALLWGFNRLVLHSYVHQPNEKSPGFTLGRHGQPFNRLNTWWPMIGDWLREISRAQYLLQTSAPVYDVLVYYGDGMPRPRPETPGLPAGARRLRIDSVALQRLKVREGQLVLDEIGSFRALIVPSNRLRAETVETIVRLAQEGATVAASRPGTAPGWSNHEEQDRRIEAAARPVWGEPGSTSVPPKATGKGKVYALNDLEKLFREINYRPDFSSTPTGSDKALMTQHRRAGNVELYGLYNPNEKEATYTCRVIDADSRTPEIWNPVTGQRQPLGDFRRENGQITFTLTIEGRRTLYLILTPASKPFVAADTPSTSTESVKVFAITTPFTVTFSGLPGLPAQSLQPPASWTDNADPKIRDYSGIAVYRTEFTLPPDFITSGSVVLDLGNVVKVARVSLNGQRAGTLWREPWRLDVSGLIKPGRNTLEIDVANTWLNRLLADSTRPVAERATFTTWSMQSWVDRKVMPEKSGLLGEITVEARRRTIKK